MRTQFADVVLIVFPHFDSSFESETFLAIYMVYIHSHKLFKQDTAVKIIFHCLFIPTPFAAVQRETSNLVVKASDLPHMPESTDDMVLVFVPPTLADYIFKM